MERCHERGDYRDWGEAYQLLWMAGDWFDVDTVYDMLWMTPSTEEDGRMVHYDEDLPGLLAKVFKGLC